MRITSLSWRSLKASPVSVLLCILAASALSLLPAVEGLRHLTQPSTIRADLPPFALRKLLQDGPDNSASALRDQAVEDTEALLNVDVEQSTATDQATADANAAANANAATETAANGIGNGNGNGNALDSTPEETSTVLSAQAQQIIDEAVATALKQFSEISVAHAAELSPASGPEAAQQAQELQDSLVETFTDAVEDEFEDLDDIDHDNLSDAGEDVLDTLEDLIDDMGESDQDIAPGPGALLEEAEVEDYTTIQLQPSVLAAIKDALQEAAEDEAEDIDDIDQDDVDDDGEDLLEDLEDEINDKQFGPAPAIAPAPAPAPAPIPAPMPEEDDDDDDDDDDEGSINPPDDVELWVLVVFVLAALVVGGGIVFCCMKGSKSEKKSSNGEVVDKEIAIASDKEKVKKKSYGSVTTNGM